MTLGVDGDHKNLRAVIWVVWTDQTASSGGEDGGDTYRQMVVLVLILCNAQRPGKVTEIAVRIEFDGISDSFEYAISTSGHLITRSNHFSLACHASFLALAEHFLLNSYQISWIPGPAG